MRPIHHQRQARVETHIFLSVLAYHLPVAMEKTLLDQGVHTSWATVRATLRTHQVCTAVLPADDGSVLRIRRASTPEPQHVERYELLSVPVKIMTLRKTCWMARRHVVTQKTPRHWYYSVLRAWVRKLG